MDVQRLGSKYPWPIYQYTVLIAASFFACGFTLAGMGPAILYIPASIPLSTLETTLVVSIVLVGALPGTFAAGWCSDRFGRRPLLIASDVLGSVSALGMAFSQTSWQLILAHGISGIAIGAFTICSGLFSVEASPPDLRGQLTGYSQLAGWTGGIAGYLAGLFLILTQPPFLAWRLIFGTAAALFILATVVLAAGLPESPRWLVHHGHDADAMQLLLKIYGAGREEQAQSEYAIIKTYSDRRGRRHSIRDFVKKEHQRPFLLAILVYTLHQLSGTNMITFYSSIILNELGLTRELSILATVLLIIPQVLTFWFIVHNMDRLGRRRPLLISLLGSGVSLVLLAAMAQVNRVHVSVVFFILAILLNRIFYSIGLGPMPPVIAAEILPFAIRGRGLAIASALGEIIKIGAVVSFLPLSRSLHPSLIYAALACVMFAGFGGTVALLKETKGESMDVLHTSGGTSPQIPS